MPDKITMINVVWMAMITGMLTATITLYNKKPEEAKIYGPYASAKSVIARQY
ncbi:MULTISPECIES: hypothetical protein [unclassified Sinorhizobium]|uniref:hypothetical protein n=1 Tax=unclassified Sinorhizobium TaxID=2613772 RepID=UPI00352383A6